MPAHLLMIPWHCPYSAGYTGKCAHRIQEFTGHFLVGTDQAAQRGKRIEQKMRVQVLLEVLILYLGLFLFQRLRHGMQFQDLTFVSAA
jgi:hypothetical protein